MDRRPSNNKGISEEEREKEWYKHTWSKEDFLKAVKESKYHINSECRDFTGNTWLAAIILNLHKPGSNGFQHLEALLEKPCINVQCKVLDKVLDAGWHGPKDFESDTAIDRILRMISERSDNDPMCAKLNDAARKLSDKGAVPVNPCRVRHVLSAYQKSTASAAVGTAGTVAVERPRTTAKAR